MSSLMPSPRMLLGRLDPWSPESLNLREVSLRGETLKGGWRRGAELHLGGMQGQEG